MELLSYKNFTQKLNDMTFSDYFFRLSLLSRAVFKWENLPPHMDEKWIEKFLFLDGRCMFFNDKKLGLMVSRCAESNVINMYEEPTELTPYGVGYMGESLKVGSECILIRNNDDMIPTSFPIKLFAYRLTETTRSIDINIHAQRTPTLLTGSEQQKKTLKAIYNQWSGFEPVIFGDKALDNQEIRALKTDAPIVFPQLQTQKQCIWNECLTFLGINNANTEKKERMITNEVDANNVHIDMSASCLLKAREKACDDINKLFGTNISVKMREDVKECMPDIQNI